METIEKTLPAKVKVVKEEPCEITFSVELPKEEVSKETDSVYQSIQSRASLPGFRVGKAPIELVRRNFSDRARQSVIENLVSRAATQIIRERKLQTVNTPSVESLDFDFGKALTFQMKVEKDPEVKAKDYKGIKVTRKEPNVTDELLSKTLEDLRERNASLSASNETKVGKSHFVVIDFEGKIDGKPFAGGAAKDYLLDMQTPQTIAGFSDGVLGAAVGQTKDVKVTFPADYGHKEYAGKEAVFQVTVKEIKEKKLPALDDEFAKDLGLTSLDELKQKVRENLDKEEKARADKETEDQIFDALLDKNAFPVPPTLVEERTKAITERALNKLFRQGLIQPGDEQAVKTLAEKSRPQAERDVRLSYIVKAISEQEKLESTDADVETLKKKALDENKDKAGEVEKYFREHASSIRASLTEGKVLDFLKSSAKVKAAKE